MSNLQGRGDREQILQEHDRIQSEIVNHFFEKLSEGGKSDVCLMKAQIFLNQFAGPGQQAV